jgi:hypothetical protein
VADDIGTRDAQALPTEWVADVGIGITLRKEPESAGSAVAGARALSRAALASSGRVVYGESRDAPPQEVPGLA